MIICNHTSLVGTLKIFDAAKNISGAGFKFSNASADTIASNLLKVGILLRSRQTYIKYDQIKQVKSVHVVNLWSQTEH